jgi:hypothetical protein
MKHLESDHAEMQKRSINIRNTFKQQHLISGMRQMGNDFPQHRQKNVAANATQPMKPKEARCGQQHIPQHSHDADPHASSGN